MTSAFGTSELPFLVLILIHRYTLEITDIGALINIFLCEIKESLIIHAKRAPLEIIVWIYNTFRNNY